MTPTQLHVTAVNSTAVKATWKEDIGSKCVLTYHVYSQLQNLDQCQKTELDPLYTTTTVNAAEFSKLEAFSTYSISVIAIHLDDLESKPVSNSTTTHVYGKLQNGNSIALLYLL